MVSFHDGFFGLAKWEGTFVNSDRTSLDIHPYLCFGDQSDATYAQRAKDPKEAEKIRASIFKVTFFVETLLLDG